MDPIIVIIVDVVIAVTVVVARTDPRPPPFLRFVYSLISCIPAVSTAATR
jgi:hypothetical protein